MKPLYAIAAWKFCLAMVGLSVSAVVWIEASNNKTADPRSILIMVQLLGMAGVFLGLSQLVLPIYLWFTRREGPEEKADIPAETTEEKEG